MKKLLLPTGETTADVVILANGQFPGRGTLAGNLLHHPNQRVVCCDGAADKFAAHGGTPLITVGDGDSIADPTAKGFLCVPDQNSNDLTKAFRYCLSQGWKNIIIVGATGLREDHTLANISLLCSIYTPQCDSVMILSDYGCFVGSRGDVTVETFAHQQVSLFASCSTKRLTAIGLRYPLPDGGIPMLWQGSLNEAIGNSITIVSDNWIAIYRAF